MENLSKYVIFALALSLGMLLSACNDNKTSKPTNDPPKLNDYKTTDDINGAKKDISEATTGFGTIGKTIYDYMVSLKKALDSAETKVQKASPVAATQAAPDFQTIRDNADKTQEQTTEIAKLNEKLKAVQTKLDIANGKVVQMQNDVKTAYKDRDKAIAEMKTAFIARDKAIAERNNQTAKLMGWIIAACMVGFVGSVVFAIMVQPKIGGAAAVGCVAGVVLAVTLQKYADYVGWGVLAFLAVGAAMMLYQIWIRTKAVTEVTHTAEIAKLNLEPKARRRVFGSGPVPGLAYQIQCHSTEKLVNNVRSKFRSMWEPTVRYQQGSPDEYGQAA